MKEINKRATIQKTIVWNMIQSMHNHPCAETVYQEIVKTNKNISRATVFRILNDLAKENKITRIHSPYGADCYDYKTYSHYHAQCSNCKSIADIEIEDIKIPALPIENANFTIKGFSIMYEGICSNCKNVNEA